MSTLKVPEGTPQTLLEAAAKILELLARDWHIDGQTFVHTNQAQAVADIIADYLRQKFCTTQVPDLSRVERDRFREMLRVIEHGGTPSWLADPAPSSQGCTCADIGDYNKPLASVPCAWCQAHE